jgi:hypothetical protein
MSSIMEKQNPQGATLFIKYRSATDGVLNGLATVETRLKHLLRVLDPLLADEHFLNLLRAEGLTKMPHFIRDRLRDPK